MIDGLQCQDCISDAIFDRVAPGVYHLTIAHDDTCPWFAQREQYS
jgi:hypothetical protein